MKPSYKDVEKQYQWQKKGKKFKKKYFEALGQLFGECQDDKEKQQYFEKNSRLPFRKT